MESAPDDSLLAFLHQRSGKAHSLHVPGHKRNLEALPQGLPWDIDVTEVPPFDNLQNPDGILAACMAFAARYWQSQHTYYLVGGSTAGILAGIRACTKRGDIILMARNCHQSVYHAVELCGLWPVFLDPPIAQPQLFYGSITPEAVKNALLLNAGIRLCVITSPTYEGVVSDINGITAILHKEDIPLLVDAAHGAHLDLPEKDGFFPDGALQNGADLVVQSLHKMLPSLTQTALLQLNAKRISRSSLQHQLSIFQSSSPSYPLMASIDYCCRILATSGKQLSAKHAEQLKRFYVKIRPLTGLRLVETSTLQNVFAFDPAKLVIDVTNSQLNGFQLEKVLRENYSIKAELASHEYLLAVTSLYSREETLDAFAEALIQIDKDVSAYDKSGKKAVYRAPVYGKQVLSIEAALQSKGERLALQQSAGRISQEYVWLYPPGVPLLTPGQRISKEFIDWVITRKDDCQVYSTEGLLPGEIFVVF